MTVKLYVYNINSINGLKQPTNGVYSFGNMFKGNQARSCFTIFNSGDTPAISPVVTIKPYPTDNDEEPNMEPVNWKRLSFMEASNYGYKLELPDIQPNSWLEGKDVYSENFNNYPVVAGTPLDSTWMTWQNVSTTWEVYNGWLQHNVDTQDGKACWTQLPKAKDYIYAQKMTIRNDAFGGVLLRHTGDYDTGYIVLLQGMYEHLEGKPAGEGIIQIFSGKYSEGIKSWTKLWSSGSVGKRGTHDSFKVKLTDNKFEIWFKNDTDIPNFTFIDEDRLYNDAAQPVILCSANVLCYFEDIYMEVKNSNGVIWVQDIVDANTPLYGTQKTYLDISYGGVE